MVEYKLFQFRNALHQEANRTIHTLQFDLSAWPCSRSCETAIIVLTRRNPELSGPESVVRLNNGVVSTGEDECETHLCSKAREVRTQLPASGNHVIRQP